MEFGPIDENDAIFGAGLVKRTVVVLNILATGFLQQAKSFRIVLFRNADFLSMLKKPGTHFSFVMYD